MMVTVGNPGLKRQTIRLPFALKAVVSGALLMGLTLLSAGDGGAAEAAPDGPATWAVYDAAPFMMTEGPDRDTGVFDQIRRILDERLVGHPQRTLMAPFPRVVASLKDEDEICFIGGVKTPERDKFAVFSLPVAMFYPLRIVVHGTNRARFASIAPLTLKALLAEKDLRSSFLKDRSLGSEVDALLKREPPPHLHSDFGEAFRMLLADRLDYLVEYSAIAAYGAKRLGDEGAFFEFPFEEAPAPVFNRVMCPKTDWGRGLIARIDEILRAERPTPAYRRIVEAWAADVDLATIRKAYDAAFLKTE